MNNNIARIRAALELASEIVPPMFATHAKIEDGLAALAELEKAAAEPVTHDQTLSALRAFQAQQGDEYVRMQAALQAAGEVK